MTNNRKILGTVILVALLVLIWLLLPSRPSRVPPEQMPVERRPFMTLEGWEEAKKFHGEWEFLSMEVNGEQKPDSDFKKWTVLFQDDQWIVSEGTNIAAQTTLVLDPNFEPKQFSAYPPPGRGAPIHGIYVFEGDMLTICDRGEDNGNPPTDFGTEPNSGLVQVVLKRVRR